MSEISICIPVDYRHFYHVPPLLASLDSLTQKPDEVCIVVSNIPDIPRIDVVHKLLQPFKRFNIKSEYTTFRNTAGLNRNILTDISSKDTLVFQDADDHMHPERLRVIKWVFDNLDVLHLNHGFTETHVPIQTHHRIDIIKVVDLKSFWDRYFPEAKLKYFNYLFLQEFNRVPVANGPVAVKRDVIKKVLWKTHKWQIHVAEDQDFNVEAWFTFNRSAIVYEPLYYYNKSSNLRGGY